MVVLYQLASSNRSISNIKWILNYKTEASIQNGKGVEAEAGLRRLVALDEERAAKAFTSGFPNFVRIMRKFNVSGSYTLVSVLLFSLHLSMFFTD